MNRIHFLLFAVIMIALSCSKNSTDVDLKVQSVSGVIEGWQNGGLLNKLTLTVSSKSLSTNLDSATIKSDGSFSLTYPFPVPPDSMLRSYVPSQDSDQYSETYDDIIFSNSSARYAHANFQVAESQHQLPMSLFQANRFLTSDSLSAVGDFFVQYYYFNQPANISGSYRRIYYLSPALLNSSFSTCITNFNLIAAKGWNRVTTQIIQIQGSTIIYQVTAGGSIAPSWFPSWFASRNLEHAVQL